jgi:hypothetical protein
MCNIFSRKDFFIKFLEPFLLTYLFQALLLQHLKRILFNVGDFELCSTSKNKTKHRHNLTFVFTAPVADLQFLCVNIDMLQIA